MNNDNDKQRVLLSYSPSDFFYIRAEADGVMPTDNQCLMSDIYNDTWNNECNSSNYSQNSTQCYNKELCKNKEKVDWIKRIETKNSGASRKYLDTQFSYNNEVFNAINLGIGIVIITGYIIKNTYVNI
jgi:hypothetical protein